MRTTVKAVLAALAIVVGGSLAAGQPAVAEVTVQVAPGGIAFGYADGYWDREHTWHAWRNEQEAAQFRQENREHYFAWKHDRDHDQGWRDGDHWWDHH